MPMIARTTSSSTKVKAEGGRRKAEPLPCRGLPRNGKRTGAHAGTTVLQMEIVGRAVPRSTNGTSCVGRSSDFRAARRYCLLVAASQKCCSQVLVCSGNG